LKKKPKPGQTDRFRFGSVFLGQKPVWLGFSGFGSVFSSFGSVFPVWLSFGSVFFPVFFGSVRFFSVSVRFFWFFAYKTKTKPNRPVFSKF
jgi:hypothetical protein